MVVIPVPVLVLVGDGFVVIIVFVVVVGGGGGGGGRMGDRRRRRRRRSCYFRPDYGARVSVDSVGAIDPFSHLYFIAWITNN